MTGTTRAWALLALLTTGCGAVPERAEAPARAESPAPLVVVVVFDQLASWVLDRYEPRLDPRGAIRETAARGVRADVRYGYASTVTACGHTAIYTGATPRVSGVVANELHDRARGATLSVFDDGAHPVFGAEGSYGGPGAIRVETVADALHRATGGAARIVSVSLKDRGAIPGGGTHADAAVWYDKASGRFTTSTAYAPAMPPWLEAWNAAHPLDAALAPWEPEDAALLARIAGRDDAAGEGDYAGLGTTFPHAPAASPRPAEALRFVPAGTDRLLALAEAAAEEHGLGEDAVTDLLAISISGTDYTGHVFGPESWEYVDHLVRADRALGALLRRLASDRPIAVLITSDHGVAPLPEALPAGRARGRIVDLEVAALADAAIDAELGEGDWVDAFVEPYVYLSAAAEVPEVRARATAAAIDALTALDAVHAAYDARDAARLIASEDPLERDVGASMREDAPGDVYVVPAEGFVFDPGYPGGAGTNHGSPWEHDRVVPAIFAGPGVAPSRPEAVFEQARVAATIRALLGVPASADVRAEPLPGAP